LFIIVGTLILTIAAGCILSTGTRRAWFENQLSSLPKCATPSPTNQPASNPMPNSATAEPVTITVLPEIELSPSDKTGDWVNYQNKEYGFSFAHPKPDKDCCMISPYTSQGAIQSIITLADTSTGAEGTDKPFDGLGVAIDTNKNNPATLQEYVSEYIEKRLKYPDTESGELSRQFTEQPVTFNNHAGIILKGFIEDVFFFKLPSGAVLMFIK
jgi:hypothetical protein